MSTNAPWSVKGIDPKAREIAKDLARREGKTLGEWLNEKIIEGGGDPSAIKAPPAGDQDDRSAYREVMQDLSRTARDVDPRDPYAEGRRARPTASLYPEPPRRSRFDDDYAGEDELSRVTRALERLSSRIEAAENRSTVAITGIDQSVVGVLSRLDTVERDNNSIAARFEGAIEDLKVTQRSVGDRLQRLEEDEQGPRQAEAMRSLEAALGKIAGQLYEGEQRTHAAIGDIRQGVKEELGQQELRTRAAITGVREEIADSESRTRAAFGVLREEMGERDQRTTTAFDSLTEIVARTEHGAREAATELRRDMGSLSARVERTEQRMTAASMLPPRPSVEPGLVMDQVMARVSERLERAESQTSEALRSLESSFAALDDRLRAAEGGLDPEFQQRAEARFESIAAELAQSVERAREEMAHRISVTADGGRFDELEKALNEVGGHVEAAERRSNEAIERMGREIMRLTEALSARVTNVESESANAVERVTAVVEKRLDRVDGAQAEALERLGDEMARLGERLADRVDASERRAAEAIEDVGERVASVTEKLQERYEKTAETLAERIRASEERSQRMLEETRQKLDARLGEAQRGLTDEFSRKIGETQQGLSDQLTRKIGESQQGLTDQFTRKIGEAEEQLDRRIDATQEDLSAQLARSIGETEEEFARRMRESQQALGDQFARRMGETQEQFERRISEARRGMSDQLQSRLAEVEARADRMEIPAAPPLEPFEPASAFASTVFTPEAAPREDVVDDDLQPFGSYAAPVAPTVAGDDGFRRTPMEPDALDLDIPEAVEPVAAASSIGFDEPEAAADFVMEPAAEPAPAAEAEPAFEADPAAADVLDAVAFDAAGAAEEAARFPAAESAFGDDDMFSEFDAGDEFVTDASAPPPAVSVAAASAAAAPTLSEPLDLEPMDLGAPAFEPEPVPQSPRSSTREMLEAARAAARAAGEQAKMGRAKPLSAPVAAAPGAPLGGLKNTGPVAPMSVDPFLKTKSPSFSFNLAGLLGGLRKGKKDEKEAQTLRTAMLVAGVSFAFGASGAGYYLINKNAERNDGDGQLDRARSGERATPLAASLVLEGTQAAARAAAPAPGEQPAAMYVTAVRSIESGDTQAGLSALRRSAELGHAPAQFYLGKLYENGEAGLAKDAAQARRWTERAAVGGDRKAMHNLALLYFAGEGGPQNQTTAARWFRRAAEQGLVDSQYNLGRLYEEGFGVPVNAAEAYKWYLIAGRAGDSEARLSAQRLQRTLSPDALATAQRTAQAFRAQAPTQIAATAPAGAASQEVVAAQRALSRLGFYQGPADGVSSPALRRAIAAWQRDQGLIPTGVATGDVLARLTAAG